MQHIRKPMIFHCPFLYSFTKSLGQMISGKKEQIFSSRSVGSFRGRGWCLSERSILDTLIENNQDKGPLESVSQTIVTLEAQRKLTTVNEWVRNGNQSCRRKQHVFLMKIQRTWRGSWDMGAGRGFWSLGRQKCRDQEVNQREKQCFFTRTGNTPDISLCHRCRILVLPPILSLIHCQFSVSCCFRSSSQRHKCQVDFTWWSWGAYPQTRKLGEGGMEAYETSMTGCGQKALKWQLGTTARETDGFLHVC